MPRPPARDQQVLRDVTEVVVDLRGGRVELAGQQRATVRLRTTARTRWWDRPVGVQVEAGRMTVGGRRTTARVELALPHGMPVRVRLRRGDVTLWGASGRLDLATGDGQVAGRDIGDAGDIGDTAPAAPPATSVLVRAPRGPVRLHLRSRPAGVDVVARDEVAVVVPAGGYDVQARAAVGAPEIDDALTTAAAGPTLHVESRRRTVRVVADAGARAI